MGWDCRYTLQDMREYGRKKGWCPYYLARHMLAFANVIVYNYQYMLDPKVSSNEDLPHHPCCDGHAERICLAISLLHLLYYLIHCICMSSYA